MGLLGKGQFERLNAPARLDATPDFLCAGGIQPKLHRFGQHGVRLLAGLALAGDAQFGTGGHEPAFLALYDRL